jgi:type IX secretion system PorP/SprF family membrane protein
MKNKLLFLSVFILVPTILFGTVFDHRYYNSFIIPERNSTQFYALPYNLNPAMTGLQNYSCRTNGRFISNYRNQNFGSQYLNLNSIQIGYDQHVNSLNGGLGMMITRDHNPYYGSTHTTVNAMYAYVLPVTKNFFLRAGIQASYSDAIFDVSIINQSRYNYYDYQPITSNRISYPNLSAGIIGYSKKFFFGYAMHNIFEPVNSFKGEEKQFKQRIHTLHGGREILLNKNKSGWKISPNFILTKQFYKSNYMYTAYPTTGFNIGTYVNKGVFVSGVWFNETNLNSTLLLGIQKERYSVGYRFDVSLFDNVYNYNSHEITISYRFMDRKSMRRYRQLCKAPIPAF